MDIKDIQEPTIFNSLPLPEVEETTISEEEWELLKLKVILGEVK